jgi:undecaprenyl-diphosphatase
MATPSPPGTPPRSSPAGGCSPRHRTGAAVITATVAIIAVVGLSRIYLGVHWLTDVLGGYLLGAAWLALMLAGRSRHGGLGAAPVRPVVVVDEATDATDPW